MLAGVWLFLRLKPDWQQPGGSPLRSFCAFPLCFEGWRSIRGGDKVADSPVCALYFPKRCLESAFISSLLLLLLWWMIGGIKGKRIGSKGLCFFWLLFEPERR